MPGLDSNVKLLLHCNGIDEGSSFPDASDSAHLVTANNDAETSTDESKFGTASYLSEGAGDFLSVPDSDDWDFGIGDFTIDFWIRPTELEINYYQTIMVQATPENPFDLSFLITVSGNDATTATISLVLTSDYLDPWNYDGSPYLYPQLTLNTWTHIAFVRQGDNFYSFQDGVLIDTGNNYAGNTIPSSDASLYIGGTGLSNEFAYPLVGFMDEIRISKGIARWTSTFTPPSAEYSSGGGGDESLNTNEDIILSDNWITQINPDSYDLDETINLLDSWEVDLSNLLEKDINEDLLLEDSWEVTPNPQSQSLSNSIYLDDDWDIMFPVQYIKFNTDLRWLELFKISIKTALDWILAKTINTDLRWLKIYKPTINTDLRWLSLGYDAIHPINYTNIQIFINGVDVFLGNDVNLQSGNITHTVGNTSSANFTLARRHDDLDRTHLGIASQITNQNPVQIYIYGHLEFDGFISAIAVDSQNESVTVTAKMDEPADNRHSIEIPLPSINEQIHLYHCLVNNINIDNPKEDTRSVIIGNNSRYWNGSNWVFAIEEALTFNTDAEAEDYVEDLLTDEESITNEFDRIFTRKSPSVTTREKNPQYYKGVKVNLGKQIQQQIDKYRALENIINDKGVIASAVENGTYITKPNYSYFWSVLVKNALTGIYNGDYRYIGTSLASTTTDLWIINGATPAYQRIKENLETELGYYYIGLAPYKEISSKNGKLIVAAKWQDKSDGLYNAYDASYDYINFAKIVAGLEYEKLKNVHGDILPITSANLDVTFDGYYYYNIKLLTRINVTNTTVSDTYKNLNGFPVSVKTININFSSMKITLGCDNRLSQEELDEIDAQMPDDESPIYVTPETSVRVYRKFDLKTWEFVS